jgi:hypothetical protein
MLLSKKPEERRKSPRYPLERLAEIHIGAGTPPRLCLVIDVSRGGVRLNCSGFDIPDEFVCSSAATVRLKTALTVWSGELGPRSALSS